MGSRLLRELGERCAEAGIAYVVARCPEKAPWARRFLDAMGFAALTDPLPKPVAEWRDHQTAGDELAKPGEVVLWRAADKLGMKILPGVPLPK